MRLARACFKVGRDYLSRVENLRCRIAGYAYIHRFEVVLDNIECEEGLLRAQYPERKGSSHGMKMMGSALWQALKYQRQEPVSSALTVK